MRLCSDRMAVDSVAARSDVPSSVGGLAASFRVRLLRPRSPCDAPAVAPHRLVPTPDPVKWWGTFPHVGERRSWAGFVWRVLSHGHLPPAPSCSDAMLELPWPERTLTCACSCAPLPVPPPAFCRKAPTPKGNVPGGSKCFFCGRQTRVHTSSIPIFP